MKITPQKKEFCVFAHAHIYMCTSVLVFKYVGASVFFKHKDSVGYQPQKDWLPDLVFKQMARCRRTRQESFGQDRNERWESWSKGCISELGKGPMAGRS